MLNRLATLDLKIAITNDIAYQTFNECVPMCMIDSVMPMMKPHAKKLKHNGDIIVMASY